MEVKPPKNPSLQSTQIEVFHCGAHVVHFTQAPYLHKDMLTVTQARKAKGSLCE